MRSAKFRQPKKTSEDCIDASTDEQGRQQCNECNSRLKHDNGELVCAGCGLVIDETNIDHGPEWRAYDAEESKERSRVGSPTTQLLHDKGLRTTIDWRNKDGYGEELSANKRRQFKRLRKWDKRYQTSNSQERTLRQALGEIERMGSALGLNDTVRETAGIIFRRIQDENLLPGRSIESASSASLYAAARQCQSPRSIEEITRVSRIDCDVTIHRCYRYIGRELSLEVEPADPRSFLNRYLNELEVENKPKLQNLAAEIIEAGEEELATVGKSPTGIAAAAIYSAGVIAEADITQSELKEISDISEVTIRNRYKELLNVYTDGEFC